MKIRLIIAYLLNLFDLICTNRGMSLYGLSVEANPIGRWLYQNHLAAPVKVFGGRRSADRPISRIKEAPTMELDKLAPAGGLFHYCNLSYLY